MNRSAACGVVLTVSIEPCGGQAMGKAGDLSATVESVQRQFERWRRGHRPRLRIPQRLWAAAVEAVDTVGIHRAAKALRVDYYS
jgi:hypothetical protein